MLSIQLQGIHGRPPNFGETDDFEKILRPLKVIVPCITSGVKQPHLLTCQRIYDGEAV